MKIDLRINREKLRGGWCFGGLDISSSSGLVSWVLILQDLSNQEILHIVPMFWCPKLYLKSQAKYLAWHEEGWLSMISDDCTDHGAIYEQILMDVDKFNIHSFGVEYFLKNHPLIMRLMEKFNTNGHKMVCETSLDYLSTNEPLLELERRLSRNQINYYGNPILRWMADNVRIIEDSTGNKKLEKLEKQSEVGGIIGALFAFNRYLHYFGCMNEGRGVGGGR